MDGESILAGRNLMIVDGADSTVTMELYGNRIDLDKVNSSNITLIADVTKIYDVGVWELPYSHRFPGDVPSGALSVQSKNPGTIKLTVDKREDNTVPVKIIIPVIIAVCLVGSYSDTYSFYGVLIMIISGICGYIFEKSGYGTAPMLLSFVLAPLLEDNLRKAFVISGGSVAKVFFNGPISIGLTVAFCAIVSAPIIRLILKKAGLLKPKKAN